MILLRIKLFLFLLLLAGLFGCAMDASKHRQEVVSTSTHLGFHKKVVSTSTFKLTTFAKLSDPNQPLVIYIEGDGHSVQSKYRLSNDPTPHQPLAFELALLDPRPNVIYIARPCQYTPVDSDPYCQAKYWSTHRFSKEVIESTQNTIGYYRKQNRNPYVHLIGFSGGGGLAALVAAHDSHTLTLTTVAGDLNTQLMQAHHHTTPLWGSYNPLSVASQLNKLPQQHWVGKRDKIVPTTIAQSFVEAQNNPCAKVTVLDKMTHHKGWKQAWAELVQQVPSCSNQG